VQVELDRISSSIADTQAKLDALKQQRDKLEADVNVLER
jgi:cell division protein FtsB